MISADYDHISYLVQLGLINILMILKHLKTSFVYLVHSYVGTLLFAGNIYAVVSPSKNECDTNYMLACCMDGNQTLNLSLMDSKGNQFPIRSMVIEG